MERKNYETSYRFMINKSRKSFLHNWCMLRNVIITRGSIFVTEERAAWCFEAKAHARTAN